MNKKVIRHLTVLGIMGLWLIGFATIIFLGLFYPWVLVGLFVLMGFIVFYLVLLDAIDD